MSCGSVPERERTKCVLSCQHCREDTLFATLKAMLKIRLIAIFVLFAGFGTAYFNYASEVQTEGVLSKFPFKLGLDLAGGTHLTYRADVSKINPTEVDEAMEALRDVIERRVNLFGVSEPVVQVERTSGIISAEKEHRLIVELPGVTDIDEAVALIDRTPLLEFRLINPDFELPVDTTDTEIPDNAFIDTGLTGRLVKHARLEFGTSNSAIPNEPVVALTFNSEGADLFEEITGENVGEVLVIFLDGSLRSAPVIREKISGGTAVISGNFTPDEAKILVRDLNLGALPVPIELLGSQTIGASLGEESRSKGVVAGMLGLSAVALFMLLWYRVLGFVAVLSLLIYGAVMLALFKLIPVTLTAAGIAGFILSIGMAVDANVLIFERLKEELKEGSNVKDAIHDGFARAWSAIRDANTTSIITAVILFWFGTSLVKGFALVFGIGVLVSMLTAISVTRTLLLALSSEKVDGAAKFLFGSGLTNWYKT